MGEGDYAPQGGHRRRYDPKHAAAIKKGGKKAQQIAKDTRVHHQTVEVPQAEEELMKELEELGTSSSPASPAGRSSEGGEQN